MAGRESTPEELEDGRDERFRRLRISRQEALATYLKLAKRFRADNGLETALVDAALAQVEDELGVLHGEAGKGIGPRKKAKIKSPATCTVFVDECGNHTLKAKEELGAFCLASVIVRDEDRDVFEAQWRRWKLRNLGAEDRTVHEPTIRKRSGAFHCAGDDDAQRRLVDSLSNVLRGLDFTAIACVLNRKRYVEQFGYDAMDASLPRHGYLMVLHFAVERIALALQHQFSGAKAHIVLESRGPKEDAMMQYEFARLFLDGTSYLHPAYFRSQFFPGLEFRSKSDHVPGLEVADLLARPCAEKVLSPSADPERWQAFRDKLCPFEGETKHSILGLKVVPWDEACEDLWKS